MFSKVCFYLPVFTFLFFCQSASAQFPFTESFKNSTANNLFFGGTPNAFLTAGSIDPEGDGYLRLTDNGYGQTGFVHSTVKFPSSKGFTVDFEYYTYGGDLNPGADGITFFLFDATADPFNIGAFGGALGYAQRILDGNIFPGVSKAYLGVGLDEWGNFSNPDEGRQGGIGQRPNSITLRGAGNGSDQTPNNYPYLTSVQTTALPAPFDIAGGDRNATSSAVNGFRKAIIELEPQPGGGYFITVKVQHTEAGVTKTETIINNYPYSTPAPQFLQFGFASSTGGANNYHEIRNIHFTLPPDAVVIPPTATDDSFSIAQSDLSGNVQKDIMNNDFTNNAGSGLDTSSIDLDPSTTGIQSLKLIPGKGTFSVRDGKINFIPVNSTITGTFSTKYTITDDFGGDPSNEATITVTVAPLPLAENDEITVEENSPVTFDITTNDTGTGGNTLDLTSIDLDPETPGQQKTQTVPGQGTFTANEDGTITFVPITDFTGTVTPVNYTIKDNAGTVSQAASIVVTVTGTNAKPIAENDEVRTLLNTPVSINVTENDSDPDGTIDNSTITVITEPLHGTITTNPANGMVSYTPENGYKGPDSFTYTVKDNQGKVSEPATVNISVNSSSKIGLAKKLVSADQAGYQAYDLVFKFTITNFGDDNLQNIALNDDLSKAFPGTEFTISNLTSTGNLKTNSLYDGRAKTNLLSTASSIEGGETAEVELKIHVKTTNQSGLFKNTASVEAVSPVTGQTISDTSTDGLKPDPETPGDISSSVETEINLTGADVFIPSGFSPNGDGINDKLVIDNPLSKRIALEIYNRWGNRIYKNPDYKNNWEGICSEGIHVGEEIPDGTYFYIVVIENGTKQVGQLTIKR